MSYYMIQRELESLGQDLIEMADNVVPQWLGDPPADKSLGAPVAIKPLPELLNELQYVQARLAALLGYVQVQQENK